MDKEDQGAFLKGFALSGEYIKGLKDKAFTIITEPKYIEIPDLNNPDMKREKLVCDVELANGDQQEWYPNKTSQRTIANKVGHALKNWIGYQGEFEIKEQLVGKDTKQVIYVKS